MENQQLQTIAQTTQTNSDVTTWALPEGAIARLGRGIIADLAFSPDGESLAIATTVGAWIYELATMEPIALLATERGLVSTISFSPNGQWIATSNWDGIIKVWETETQRCIVKIQGSPYRNALAFSPDSQYLAASGSGFGGAYVWNTTTGMHVASFKGAAPSKKGEQAPAKFLVCFSPDGQSLAYVSGRGALAVRHIETKEHITILKHSSRKQIQGLAFSPCGQFLAVGSQNTSSNRQNTELQVWDLDNETVEMTDSDYGGDKLIPAYSSDGTLRVADLHKDKVMLWDASQREQLDTFEYRGNARNAFRFSYDGQQFAIATECEMRVWHADASLTVASHLEHTVSKVRTLFFMQGGKTLVSGYAGKSGIVFWDVVQKRARQTLSTSYGSCALSPCEEMLATAVGENGETIEVLRVVSGTPITTLIKHKRIVTALAFSPTGEHLVSGDEEGNLYVWTVEPWRELREFIGHTGEITAMVFHPNGSQIATISHDRTARVWDFENGEQFASLPIAVESDVSLYRGDQRQIRRIFNHLKPGSSHTLARPPITFSPSGDIIAGGLQREIRLWDATTYKTRMSIILPDTCQRPNVVIFSPCGRYLVSGSWWQEGQEKVSIRLWEVSTGKNIATFWSHPTDIQDLAFSPDGMHLASGGFDGTILLWDMKPFIDA